MKSYKHSRDLPMVEYDVLVAGGGPAGVCAAVAAARDGARTLLIEATGALGGMMTQGLVSGWCGAHDQIRLIHNALAKEIIMNSQPTPHGYDFIKERPYNDMEHLKRFLDKLVLDSGAELLFYTTLAGVSLQSKSEVSHALICNKAGLQAVKAKVFIDCTGDGDLAAWAGAEYLKDEMQPVSLCFSLAGNDMEAQEAEQPEDWRKKIVDNPSFPLIRDDFFREPYAQFSNHNAGHLWYIDNTDPHSQTRAMIEGRQEAKQFLEAFKEIFPKRCANTKLVRTAPLLGVRETRRIIGDYILTLQDHQERRRFDDDIALNSFFIDVHPSLEQRSLERQGLWSWKEIKDSTKFKVGEFHGIPYRCLTPKGLKNVIVAGRCISCDREALSAVRIMPCCMSMGEAAGVAAAQAAGADCDVHAVNVNLVQERLRETGGFLP